jgi:hypothetical protein
MIHRLKGTNIYGLELYAHQPARRGSHSPTSWWCGGRSGYTTTTHHRFPSFPPLHSPLLCRRGRRGGGAMAATAPSSSDKWMDWAAECTKAAQAEARSPPEWAAAGSVPWSAGLAETLAGALLSESGGGAAAWKYAEAALAARLASPPLLIALLSTRYVRLRPGTWWDGRFRALRRVVGRERRMGVREPGAVPYLLALTWFTPKKVSNGNLIQMLCESVHNAGSNIV